MLSNNQNPWFQTKKCIALFSGTPQIDMTKTILRFQRNWNNCNRVIETTKENSQSITNTARSFYQPNINQKGFYSYLTKPLKLIKCILKPNGCRLLAFSLMTQYHLDFHSEIMLLIFLGLGWLTFLPQGHDLYLLSFEQ